MINMDTSLGLETLWFFLWFRGTTWQFVQLTEFLMLWSGYVEAVAWTLCSGYAAYCGLVRIPWRISVLMGHSLGFMLHMLSSPLRPGGQRPYNGATPVGGGRWPFHPLILWHSASISCHNMYGPRFRVVPSAGRLVPIVHTSVSDISPHLILNLKSVVI